MVVKNVNEIHIGDIFDRWTVIGTSDRRTSNGGKFWLCQCSCEKHTIKEVSGNSLNSHTSKSCGCLQKEKAKSIGDRSKKDISGQKFGMLTVIKYIGHKNDKRHSLLWKCKCECGNKCYASVSDLTSGKITSCGCKNSNDLTDRIFGRYTVIRRDVVRTKKTKRQYYICQCSCGKYKSIRGDALLSGTTLSCGCLSIENNNRVKTLSFNDWCIDVGATQFIELWDYEINQCSPKDICYQSNKSFYFHCSEYKHKSEAHQLGNLVYNYIDHKGKISCSYCGSFAQNLIDLYKDNALELYWSDKNIVNPWEIASQSNIKVWIKCQEKDYHDDYEISCNNFYAGKRCSYCGNHQVHPLDSLGTLYPQVLDIWSDKNEKSPYEYSPKSEQKVFWKCSDGKHEDYERSISSSQSCEFRCPECSHERDESLLQEKVRLYLETLNYYIKHEYNCTLIPHNPRTKFPMPFDNEIADLKLLIEVQGSQHYQINSYTSIWRDKRYTPEEQLHKRKLYDRYKKYVAFCNGYFYLAIPYWTDDKEETYKKLIDDKIKEIKQLIKVKSVA